MADLRGRPAKTSIKLLVEDTHVCTEELKTKMEDRDGWRRFVKLSQVNADKVSKEWIASYAIDQLCKLVNAGLQVSYEISS